MSDQIFAQNRFFLKDTVRLTGGLLKQPWQRDGQVAGSAPACYGFLIGGGHSGNRGLGPRMV